MPNENFINGNSLSIDCSFQKKKGTFFGLGFGFYFRLASLKKETATPFLGKTPPKPRFKGV